MSSDNTVTGSSTISSPTSGSLANNSPINGSSTDKQPSNTKALYRTIWRWHFYAGIFCIPFVILLALTGSIYLFKPYYEHWQERDYRGLDVSSERQLPNAQIAAALASVEGGKLLSYRLPQADNEAVLINVQAEQTWLVYINPYTLEVLGSERKNRTLMELIRTFHGELLLGNFGSILVELAACWAIVLIVTGLYLWWPRNANGVAGVIYPRLRQGSRTFWRDLHAVTGIWISMFALFLLISGLPWALVWGASLKEIRSFSAAPVQQDWAQNRHEEHMHFRSQANASFNLTLAILTTATELQFAPPVELSIEDAERGAWKLSSQSPNRPQRVDAVINAEGSVEQRKDFSDKKALDRVIGIGIAAHEGYLFGWFNLVLGVFTCMGLILVSVSGFILWRKRKPQSVLGAPPPLPARVGAVVVVITLGLALFLPLMAISLVSILLLEFALLRRLSVARQWLGLPD
jgi:uncharacterized iron-regulated membrane protein